MIISDGYNGTPSGFENVCEDENNQTKPYVLHAEANAITKVAKSSNSSAGATLYVTSSPCMECAKLIIQAGIKRVVFTENYRIEDGINLLKRALIEIVRIETDLIWNNEQAIANLYSSFTGIFTCDWFYYRGFDKPTDFSDPQNRF